MSTLTIVRHGQASFLSGDYDQLSPLGVDQSRRLGIYWATQGLVPTHLVVGPRRRHQQTLAAVEAGIAHAGGNAPVAVSDDRLDEFDWDGLFRYANSTLSRRDTTIASLKTAFDTSESPADKRRTIQHYMEAVTAQWAREAFHEEGLETWKEFSSRVAASAIGHTRNVPRGSRVALVTSGGVASAISGHVLGLSSDKTLGLIWTLRNGALVEFLFHCDRMSLSSFNNAPHLPEKELWTYR
jgi:broad specificity phosphatase PhoE